MRVIFAILLCSLVVLIKAAITKEGEVLILDQKNFDEAISTHPLILVEFYAPWYAYIFCFVCHISLFLSRQY